MRVTGILFNERGQMPIVKQHLSQTRHWSLPGGRLEHGETMEEAIVRKLKEETGLGVAVESLL